MSVLICLIGDTYTKWQQNGQVVYIVNILDSNSHVQTSSQYGLQSIIIVKIRTYINRYKLRNMEYI